MKIIFILLTFILTNVYSSSYSQKVTLSGKRVPLKDYFSTIKKQTGYVFFYDQKQLKTAKRVSINVVDASLFDALKLLFKDQPLDYNIENKTIVIGEKAFNETGVMFQDVTGKVSDSKGVALAGVVITVKGTNTSTTTNSQGNYTINVPANSILVFSYLGFVKQEISVGTRVTVDVTLVSDDNVLDEVVVVGYGVQKKANLTGAVDQITSEALENRAVPNLTQGLQGVMPNLNIVLKDGKPTQSPSYNIRGTTSIGQGGSALILIDGVEGDPSLLNPNDIESVSMLKDAASASIYGARGVFGVVLITTKKPGAGKTSVNYSSNYSTKSPIQLPDFVTDGYTWAKMFSEAFVNGDGSFPQNMNKTQKFSQAYLDEFKKRAESGQPYNAVEVNPVTGEYTYYGNTDFYGELYKKSTGAMENNLSITGSSDKTSYLISGRLVSQDGLFRYNSDDYGMKNFRARGTIQVFPWLQIDNNADYSVMNYHNPLNVGEGGGIWRNIADEGHPTSLMFNPDGSLTMSAVYGVGDFWYGKNGIDTKRSVFRNTAGFASKFFDNKFRVTGDFTFRNTDNDKSQKRVQVPYSATQGVTAYVGTTTNDLLFDNRETQYLATNLVTEYETTVHNNHYFKILAGFNYESSTYQRLSAQRNGIIYEDASDINLALGQAIITAGGWEKWNILGGFSRLNYVFKDKYLLEVNARYDGSSKFPDNQRFGFFPSVSAGWRLAGEKFWHVSPKIISDLKLRASYGSLGNGNVDSYVYQENFSISQSGRILNGIRPQRTGQPGVLPNGITWETSTTTNFGLDLSMLSSRINLTGDVYVRNTTDMYTTGLTAPNIFGAAVPKGNYADLRTNGWELALSWRDQINIAKPINYNVRFTLSDNKSKITKFNNPDKLLTDYYEGQTIGEIWGYTTEGFFKDQADIDAHAKQSPEMRASPTNIWYPGDIKLQDRNGDGFVNRGTNRVSDPGDRTIIGNSAPRYTYGANLGAEWNNFFFSTFFQGVGKQDWYPSPEAEFFWGQYNRPYNNIPKFHLGNMWTPENTNAYFPRTMSRAASSATSRELGVPQTKYLQNIAYIRMKNIQLGYNIPQKLISKIKASNAKVYVSGENLWSYSPLYKLSKNLDVENTGRSDADLATNSSGDGYNYPMLKALTLGISIVY